jgi:hypothetical protein
MASTEHSPHPSATGAPSEALPEPPARRRGHRRLELVLSLVLLVAAAGGTSWFILRHDAPSSAKRAPANTASVHALASLATAVGHPVYWAGPKPGYRYELTHTTDGRIYIRYLPAGVPVGTSAPDYLTVGTYPVKDALATVRAIGTKTGGSLLNLAGGAIGAVDPAHPQSVYVAYPGSQYEIEVYDPSAGRARSIVASGAIAATNAGPSSVTPVPPQAASIADLRALASSSGHLVYWAGAQTGKTYELSELADGRIFVRYLPKGVRAGTRRQFPTVGTYPVRNAFAAVQAIAQRPGATRMPLSNGGLAVTDPAHPTSVYLAYPNGTVEVEVFDPSAARARRTVMSGGVVPVS